MCFMPDMFIQRHDSTSSVPVSARALCQSGHQSAGTGGLNYCEGLTEHAMAPSAAASSRGEAQNAADWLSGTKLQPMADELGVWAYRLENALPADMHNRLVTLMNESFDATKGVRYVISRQHKNANFLHLKVSTTTRC